MPFMREDGTLVPAVTADQMREVDRIATEDFGLGILQMMENAGRNLALNALDMLGGTEGEVAILAGAGGNGGGGLCCARHLHNRGLAVNIVLDQELEHLGLAASNQFRILHRAGVDPLPLDQATQGIRRASLVIDAPIGYGLLGAPAGETAALIRLCNLHARLVLSLDLPSGVNATSGEVPGVAIRADRTLALALPKTGLANIEGEVYLGDIGIPPEVYRRLGLSVEQVVQGPYWTRLWRRGRDH